jgi:phosphoglycolate phosphatase-like HAD superfamily hydrolase
MKNVNIFVDVDLTLVDHNQNLIPGAREALQRLVDNGCHLFLWSTAGQKYAAGIAARHLLSDLFDGFAAKPDIIIDDVPDSVTKPFVYNPNQEKSWEALAEVILKEHVD